MLRFLPLLVFLLFVFRQVAFAQLGAGKPEDIKVLREAPLLVLLPEVDSARLKKLRKKPAEREAYLLAVGIVTERMKFLATKYWKFSPAVQFGRASDLPALFKNRERKVGVLYYQQVAALHKQTQLSALEGYAMGKSYGIFFQEMEAYLVLEVVGAGSRSLIRSYPIPVGEVVHESDFTLAMKQAQQYMRDREAGKKLKQMATEARDRGMLLQRKTLLVAQEDMQAGFSPTDVAAVYPYPLKVVPRAELEAAVGREDSLFVCVRQMPLPTGYESQQLLIAINIADGMELAYYKHRGTELVPINKKVLSDFARDAQGKGMATWPPY